MSMTVHQDDSQDEQLKLIFFKLNFHLISCSHVPPQVSEIRRSRFNCAIGSSRLCHVTRGKKYKKIISHGKVQSEIAKILKWVFNLTNHTHAHMHTQTRAHMHDRAPRGVYIHRHIATHFCPHHISYHINAILIRFCIYFLFKINPNKFK